MTTVTDALVKPLEHSIRLPVFEGPLDLLLFLIRKDEIDIYDIPIESVTRQYLDILHSMEKLSLEMAGEFFVMGATLMHIKSRMLLPKNEQAMEGGLEDDEVDPRWELVQQLIEYKKFKEAASGISGLMEEAKDLLPRRFVIIKEERERRPLKPTDKIEIWNVFNQVLRRLEEKVTFGQIHGEKIMVADQMEHILVILQERKKFLFSDLFPGDSYSVTLVIASFLALLELTRLKEITISQKEDFQDIVCSGVE